MYTKGPWKVAGESQNEGEAEVIESANKTVAWTCNSLNADDEEIITSEDRANAHLIAASPDLLEACKLALDKLYEAISSETTGEWRCKEIGILEDAINKAEGGK